MSQIYDIHHEYNHGQRSPPSMPNKTTHGIHNHINRLNYNHYYFGKQGSRSDMGNLQGDKTNTRGKNYDSEMD